MYRLIKRLSIPLAICFLITSLPVQALTNNVQNQKSDNDIVTVPEKPEAKVRSEDTSKRDKFTKHYMKDDFTYYMEEIEEICTDIMIMDHGKTLIIPWLILLMIPIIRFLKIKRMMLNLNISF